MPSVLTLSFLYYIATDIVNYLSSRHGIVVNPDVIQQQVMVELSGELELEPAYKMDLVEMVALLLIPYFLNESSDRALSQVLQVMLSETDSSKLSREFLKTLLSFHGEVEVADSVLDDMMEAAGGQGAVLNLQSLKRALTSDVTKYQTEWTDSLTTHYEDVFDTPSTEETDISNPNDGVEIDEEDPKKYKNGQLEFEKVWTAPAIDFVADTYRSQTYAVLLWLTLVMVYLSYFWNCKPCLLWYMIVLFSSETHLNSPSLLISPSSTVPCHTHT